MKIFEEEGHSVVKRIPSLCANYDGPIGSVHSIKYLNGKV